MSDVGKDQAPAIWFTGFVFGALSTVAVILRFTSRLIKTAHCGWDDWTILLAQVIFIVALGLELRGVKALSAITNGAEDPNYQTYAKFIYIYGPFYFPAIGITNISVLLLYRRIFETSWFSRISLYFIIVQALWTIAGTIVQIWVCNPPSSWWTSPKPTCILYGIFWLTMMLIELLLECLMLILPVNEVRKLQLSKNRKIIVAGIFLLGGCVIITAIIRIAVSYQDPIGLQVNKDALWMNVHVGIAIVSACLPTYKPLVSTSFDHIRSYYSYAINSTGSRTEYLKSQSKTGAVELIDRDISNNSSTSVHNGSKFSVNAGNSDKYLAQYSVPYPQGSDDDGVRLVQVQKSHGPASWDGDYV
ncbi:hypothetical protein BGW36DRAFT_406079 [Talaromyces proteolyticus]|uniref:Rhodopsin domain-containing protein n=1 Tax=Talaromyces proteolyticus TaxID=1131652 RepID=A0AAD4Q0K7_9EURO|nr:uncharacterized protein BGW36DRAFT_406079 [Talaromyces proteolyticus]KAH8700939.1 hypothetical protein BGW36DRAFT_406079 [Talaromyces proteolyticus]